MFWSKLLCAIVPKWNMFQKVVRRVTYSISASRRHDLECLFYDIHFWAYIYVVNVYFIAVRLPNVTISDQNTTKFIQWDLLVVLLSPYNLFGRKSKIGDFTGFWGPYIPISMIMTQNTPGKVFMGVLAHNYAIRTKRYHFHKFLEKKWKFIC